MWPGRGAAQRRPRHPRRRDLRLARRRRGMLETGGTPLVVGEPCSSSRTRSRARRPPIAVDPTGIGGLAGLLALRDAGRCPRRRARRGAVHRRRSDSDHRDRRKPRCGASLGRDILSLKDFERSDFERVFEICDDLAPIARNRAQHRPARKQDAADGLLPAVDAHPDGDRGGHAPAGRPRARLLRREERPGPATSTRSP